MLFLGTVCVEQVKSKDETRPLTPLSFFFFLRLVLVPPYHIQPWRHFKNEINEESPAHDLMNNLPCHNFDTTTMDQANSS